MLAPVTADQSAIGRDLRNWLYCGDNLEILKRFISDETVDLVYLDPPFSRNRAYSLIFQDESGRTSDAQLATFDEYWHWGPTAARHYEFLTNAEEHGGRVPHGLSDLIGALHSSIRPSPLLAYLVEMTTRLVELRRVLKPTGSLYLHCDPTASHYLKLILDSIFGPEKFRNEIVWKRTHSHGSALRWGDVHDVLLYYGKTDRPTWNRVDQPYDESYLASKYRHYDERGRYRLVVLTAPGTTEGDSGQPWHGYDPTESGRHWAVPKRALEMLREEGVEIPGSIPEQLDLLFDHGLIRFPSKSNGQSGVPESKLYLRGGAPIQDVITDIPPINSQARERLGFPTQKPVSLMERVILASSNEGDVVLDPFCGCGTTIEAAREQKRQWIGIDQSNFAVEVIRGRMEALGVDVPVFDWPTEMDAVRRMVGSPGGRHRFEAWALTRLNAQPVRELGGKGGDQGIDGRISFTTSAGRVQTIIVSVKSGHIGSPVIRDLKGTVERERAAMGLLFTLQEPTEPMRKEAATAGFYRSPIDGHQYPKMVIHTVRELLDTGRLPDLPSRRGVQTEIEWHLPTATRPARLRPARSAARKSEPVVQPPPSGEPAQVLREQYASRADGASRAAPQSPRTSTRDRTAPLPSPESADTD